MSGGTGMWFVGEWQDEKKENLSNIKGYSWSQVVLEAQKVNGSR